MIEWSPLPEIPPPPGVEIGQLCHSFGLGSRPIWAEGNPAGALMVILDNPGAREERDGRAFVCGTRQTLRECAQAAGLKDDDLYVTWVLKCRPLRAYDKEAARAAFLPYLERQIEAGEAKVLLLMGNVALQAVMGDPTLEVKALRGQVLLHNGLPTLCSYHPLAARRRPNLKPYLVQDLHQAAGIAQSKGGENQIEYRLELR